MTETVPHTEVAVQNASPAIATTILMAITEITKDKTTMGAKPNATETIAEVTLQTEVIHTTPRRELALNVPGMDLSAKKSVIIVFEKIIQRKIAMLASKAAEWDIFGAKNATGPSL